MLLCNDGNLLRSIRAPIKIVVVGPLADFAVARHAWFVGLQDDLQETVTVFGGLRTKLGSEAELNYAPGVQIRRTFPSFFDEIIHLKAPPSWTPEQAKVEMSKAVALARSSDLTILVLGEAQNMSGEAASRESLDLPGRENNFSKRLPRRTNRSYSF